VLDDTGVPYDSYQGRTTCDQLHDGVGFTPLATAILKGRLTPTPAGDLMGAAVGAYCPDMGTALHN
jgi:hypothetical protein